MQKIEKWIFELKFFIRHPVRAYHHWLGNRLWKQTLKKYAEKCEKGEVDDDDMF